MCPYCHSLVKGQHRDVCKELRALERIDIIVGGMRHFTLTSATIRAIFVKQHLQRKGKK